MLTQERLKECVNYNPDTGLFIRKYITNRGKRKHEFIGSKKNNCGYLSCSIDGKSYPLHRLAWLYETGRLPASLMDHINGIKTDNRICNLREATYIQNNNNKDITSANKSGYKGVSWNSYMNKWRVQGRIDKKNCHIGYFNDIKDAALAYKKFALENHGVFCHQSLLSDTN